VPEGAFVLPGSYRLRLTAGGATVEQPLEVALDPRVKAAPGELAELLAFQRQVEAALARSTTLAEARSAAVAKLSAALAKEKSAGAKRKLEAAQAENDRLATTAEEDPARANEALASLASDLESVDAAPTSPQRQVLELYGAGIERFATKWQRYAKGTLARVVPR
jgi:hypothetical protein